MKKSIYFILKLYELVFGSFLYAIAQRYASLHTKMMHYKDWYFNSKNPSSYKHEINLYNWIYEPSQVRFVEGGCLGEC